MKKPDIGRTERTIHRITDRHDRREAGYVDADRGTIDPDLHARSAWYRRGWNLWHARHDRR